MHAGGQPNGLEGSVFRRGDEGYEAARCAAVWNGLKPERFPAVIVVAASQADLPRAVALARAEGLTIGIRSGGHSWVGNALRDCGMLLDLSRLKAIGIDPQARTAVVEPGVRVDELAAALSPHGLYFPVGHCPTVGVTGFLLGGGMGFNTAQLGPAAFSLRAIDVLTADGQTLHATDADHADFMWAARGSGPGFFAMVTRLYLDLAPMPAAVAATVQVHPMSAYDEVLAWFLTLSRTVECTPMLIVGGNPLFGQTDPVLTVAAYTVADDMDQAAARLAPLATAPGLSAAIVHQPPFPASIEQLLGIFNGMYPEGYRYLSDSLWLTDEFAPGLWEAARPVVDTLPSVRSGMWLIPGPPRRHHPNAAYSLQSQMLIQFYAIYEHAHQDEAMRAWHSDAIRRVDPYTLGGGYIGDSNLFHHPMAVLHPDSAERLEALRRRHDPDGRFFSYPSALPAARVEPPVGPR